MAFLEGADKSKVLGGFTTPITRYRGVVLHVAVSEARFPSYSKGLGAHFYVRKDGSFAQQIDTKFRGGHAAAANSNMIGIETQGGLKNAQTEEWTEAQVERLAMIIAELHLLHGVPLKVMANSKTASTGIGTHRLGCNGNFDKKHPGRVAGGELWSTAFGKVCPGNAKIDQVAEIVKRAKAIVAERKKETKVTEKVTKAASKTTVKKTSTSTVTLKKGSTGSLVKKLQEGLNKVFPSYKNVVLVNRGKALVADGIYGNATVAWVKEFQGRVGLTKDGIVGPKTTAALKKAGIKL